MLRKGQVEMKVVVVKGTNEMRMIRRSGMYEHATMLGSIEFHAKNQAG